MKQSLEIEPESSKKVKTTIYMEEKDDILLNEVYIKRIRERKKTDRSSLLCEGIRLLYESEIGPIETKTASHE
jgi:hypothetical protein